MTQDPSHSFRTSFGFSILDFGFWIGSLENKSMKRCRWKSFFENPKSSIQKRPRGPKWLGLSIIAFVLVVAGAVVQAQQAQDG